MPGAQSSPNLLAAIASVAKKPSASDQGKCLPENYIIKATDSIKVDEKLSYYEFVHGLMRFLYSKHVEEGKPISDYLWYYNEIATYAVSYKWYNVYKLHLACINDMDLGFRKGWGDPIRQSLIDKHCNSSTILPDKEARSDSQSRDGRRKQGGRREGDHDRHSPSRGGSVGHKKNKTCDQYNENENGCNFGKRCQFLHLCDKCFRKGVQHAMPGLWCTKSEGGQKADKK